MPTDKKINYVNFDNFFGLSNKKPGGMPDYEYIKTKINERMSQPMGDVLFECIINKTLDKGQWVEVRLKMKFPNGEICNISNNKLFFPILPQIYRTYDGLINDLNARICDILPTHKIRVG